MSLTFAIISETWLAHGSRLEQDAEDLLLGQGLAIKYLNRPPSINGVAHGGVAVVTRASITKIKDYSFPNPQSFEVLGTCISVTNVQRKFYAIAAYIPPNYTAARGKSCLEHINNMVLDIKRKTQDPYILVAGDFNQWPIGDALQDYVEMTEVPSPPTRGDRKIDKIFINWYEDVIDSGCLPPLETEGENVTFSDHKIQYLCSRVQKKDAIKWEVFTHRPYNDKGAEAFVRELSEMSWDTVYAEETSNAMAAKYQSLMDDLMDKHFPMKTTRRKETDLPWINNVGKKMIKKKNAIYKAEGKSDRWIKQCSKVEKYLEGRRQGFLQRQRDKFSGPDAARNFFKNVKSYKSAEKPKEFSIQTLRPDKSEAEVAEEAAHFFNRISNEFTPLEPGDIPSTYHRDIPLLSPANVADIIKNAKKPNSMVKGDIFPKIVNRCAIYIAWPLSAIYNKIITTYIWPAEWKREHVTIIPKKTMPEDFGDMRNISCTLFVSKIFEKYVQQLISEEIELRPNQYGGRKGCSTTHMIIEILQQMCENAEDYRSSTVLCAIDYAKAFNRLSYQHCLEAFRKKGSSTPVLRLIATFLTNRTMTVRVGGTWSEPLPVSGGCPQGSILGVSLFNTTTDDLEEDFERQERERLRLPCGPLRDDVPVQGAVGPAPPAAESTPQKEFVPRMNLDISPVRGVQHDGPRRPRIRSRPGPQPVIIEPPEENKVGTQVLLYKPVMTFKYIDDNISCEKANFGNVPIITVDGQPTKSKHALPTQNAFRSVTTKAMEKGMVVNTKKTALMCVSDALNYRPSAYIYDQENNRIDSTTSMKVLGFYFSDRPTVDLHVQNVIRQLRIRYWVLRHLGSVGFTLEELVRVYKSVLLPIADYCCPAYHPMLNDQQDQLLERAQIGALRAIYGYELPSVQLRQQAGVTTLRERRISLTDKFARKCLTSDRFRCWFPLADGRQSGRNSDKYKEFFARSDRLKNSPLYYMRRRLNGKPGKTYGERNKRYRENFAV